MIAKKVESLFFSIVVKYSFLAIHVLRRYRLVSTTLGVVYNEVLIFVKNRLRYLVWMSIGFLVRICLEKFERIQGEFENKNGAR